MFLTFPVLLPLHQADDSDVCRLSNSCSGRGNRGRDHRRCPTLDEERRTDARSLDRAGAQGAAVVLRNEVAHGYQREEQWGRYNQEVWK